MDKILHTSTPGESREHCDHIEDGEHSKNSDIIDTAAAQFAELFWQQYLYNKRSRKSSQTTADNDL